MDIAGTAAVVSGGGSGIGRATVLALVAQGARVMVADRDEVSGRQTVELASRAAGHVLFHQCDVTRSSDLAAVFEEAIGQFGRLDIAFNNAGIGGEDLFADGTGEWARIIAVDLTAIIDATRLAVRAMRRGGAGGGIIDTASLIGLWPMPSAPVYAAAKAGVVNFTRSLAYLDTDEKIRVNTICPELVDTPMARGMGEERLVELRRTGGDPLAGGHRGRGAGAHCG